MTLMLEQLVQIGAPLDYGDFQATTPHSLVLATYSAISRATVDRVGDKVEAHLDKAREISSEKARADAAEQREKRKEEEEVRKEEDDENMAWIREEAERLTERDRKRGLLQQAGIAISGTKWDLSDDDD